MSKVRLLKIFSADKQSKKRLGKQEVSRKKQQKRRRKMWMREVSG